ncbi:MAG TPA: hypothetical protein VGR35_05835 [Tepidisphaeraceae bacterium]|nr:hypothetical protein [Tepidisphaeraceae bacterium]
MRRYFGAWADPRGAERLYLAERAAWESGRDPRGRDRASAEDLGPSLLEVADRYLLSRFQDLKSPDAEVQIENKTYSGVERAMRKLIALFPHVNRVHPMQWTPDDFKRLRERLGEGVGVNTKAQYVVYVRAMFGWAALVSKILPRMPDWGDQFKYVSKHQKEKSRYLFQRQHGERLFELDEARQIIVACQVSGPGIGWLGQSRRPKDDDRLPPFARGDDAGRQCRLLREGHRRAYTWGRRPGKRLRRKPADQDGVSVAGNALAGDRGGHSLLPCSATRTRSS